MSFSVSACLSNTGTSPLGPTLSVYSNPVSTLNPGIFVRTIPTTSITGANCPFTFLVPDGTENIRIFDPVSFCYVDIAVSNNNVCYTCTLGLSGVTNNLTSLINVNGLSGTCDNDISNFVIDWYGPAPSTSLAFTSGKGTLFSGEYQYTHPINNVNSPILIDGTYTSRIRKVELNGVKFSSTGGTGNIISCNLTGCSSSVIVSPYNCNNGTGGPDPLYTHYKEFVYTDSSIAPDSLSAVFVINSTTKAFIWKFEGLSIYDTLKLTFVGSSYPQPILLEEIRVGNDAGSVDFTPTTWPKIFNGPNFKKLTVLTGLTVNNNDKIIINVTPNPSNNSTTWKYSFGCSTLPTPNKTCLDSYRNKPYKIKASTISYIGPDSCGRYNVTFSVSGCSTTDNSSFVNSDLVKLSNNSYFTDYISTNEPSKLVTVSTNYQLYQNYNVIESYEFTRGGNCTNIPGQQIKVVKSSTSQLEIYFTDLADLTIYYNDFTTIKNELISAFQAYSVNNITYNFYKYFSLNVYNGTYTCGDSTPPFESLYFHYSSTATSASTTTYPGFGYVMNITTPLITNNYTCPNTCSNCSAINTTTLVNNTRNLTGYIKNVTGYRLIKPFQKKIGLSSTGNQSNLTFEASGAFNLYYDYSHNTYPATGSGPYTLVPSLSGRTWDWENHTYYDGAGYTQEVFRYEVRVTSFSPFQYSIYAKQISNFISTGNWIQVWSSTAGIINSTYVYP